MTLDAALKASRTFGQTVNRSGLHNVMVVENDDELFHLNRQAIWYRVQVMKDQAARECFEPVFLSPISHLARPLSINDFSSAAVLRKPYQICGC